MPVSLRTIRAGGGDPRRLRIEESRIHVFYQCRICHESGMYSVHAIKGRWVGGMTTDGTRIAARILRAHAPTER
jgi:hypothetical protein